ncbi:MAG: transposase, partial [Gammaproteobacteria bacterium]
MARNPRIHYPGAIYHVILRGNYRQPVFYPPTDQQLWQSILIDALERYNSSIHCFCWMTNHLHTAIQVSEEPLAAAIRYAASQYSRKINLSQGRTGHLFERRHRAILVEDENQLKGLVRYIHNNPVRAGMVEHPGEYRWNSHPLYT